MGRAVALSIGLGAVAAAPTAFFAGWTIAALGLVLFGTGLAILGTVPAGEPLGSRRDRPHNPDGWRPDREIPPDQQGTGRPWSGVRDNRGGAR